METVGIRELKSHLSSYVARARDGERIIVTDRGRKVAELTSLDPELQALDRLTEEGRVSWSGSNPEFTAGPQHAGPSVSDAVIEQRREREQATAGDSD